MKRTMAFPHSTQLRERRSSFADETAFTFVELLVVLLVVGVLLGIAVPVYLSFQTKAQSTAASADVREAIPDANAYYTEDGNSYAGMTPGALQSTYDSGLVISSSGSTGIVSAKPEGTGQTFCISAVAGGRWAHYNGPGGTVINDPSSVTANPCP
jgi:type IV pilus assembly protein PilA